MSEEHQIEVSLERINEKQQETRIEIGNLERSISNLTSWFWGLIVIGLFIGLLLPLFLTTKFEPALYGDFVGGTVGVLWALAGMLLIYLAFLGQKQQLLNQRLEIMFNQHEMMATRFELKGQKKQLEEQNELFKLQRFETTFFNLLSNFNQIVGEIEFREKRLVKTNEKVINKSSPGMGLSLTPRTENYEPSKTTDTEVVDIYKGKDALEKIVQNLKENLSILVKRKKEDEDELSLIKNGFEDFLFDNKGDIWHYVHNFFAILSFIDKADMEEAEFYARLLQVQISPDEWNLLFGFALFVETRYMDLIDKYLDAKHISDLVFYTRL